MEHPQPEDFIEIRFSIIIGFQPLHKQTDSTPALVQSSWEEIQLCCICALQRLPQKRGYFSNHLLYTESNHKVSDIQGRFGSCISSQARQGESFRRPLRMFEKQAYTDIIIDCHKIKQTLNSQEYID
jgi:hypothetical protein